jgi:hypothetical protein
MRNVHAPRGFHQVYGFSVDTSFSPGERLNRLVPPGVLLVFRVPFGVRDDHLLRAPSRECELLPVSGDLCVVCAGIAVVLEELLWSAALSFLILSFLSLSKKTLMVSYNNLYVLCVWKPII